MAVKRKRAKRKTATRTRSDPARRQLAVNLEKEYRIHADKWERFAKWTLATTVVLVLLGLVLLLYGTKAFDWSTSDEVRVRVELAELNEKLAELEKDEARIKRDKPLYQQINRMWLYIYNAGVRARDLSKQTNRFTEAARKTASSEAQKVVAAVLSDAKLLELDPALYFDPNAPDFDGKFRSIVLSETREIAKELKFDFSTLVKPLDELAANKKEINLIPFNEADRVKRAIDDRLAEATGSLVEQEIRSLERNSQRAELAAKIETKKKELAKYDTEREQIRFMAWLPDLSIRVGAVILLLFLCGVFLASYRYTLALSAFYQSRCDCIRLATSSRGVDAEELKSFVEQLSLDVSIDRVPLPYETEVQSKVGDVIKTAITGK